jgi:hypothetical protein
MLSKFVCHFSPERIPVYEKAFFQSVKQQNEVYAGTNPGNSVTSLVADEHQYLLDKFENIFKKKFALVWF